MAGNLQYDAPPGPGGGAPVQRLPSPNPGQQQPFPPGTAQTILQWIAKLSQAIADLQQAQKAGLNVMTYMMRAQAAYQTLQNIYTTYFGQIPSGAG